MRNFKIPKIPTTRPVCIRFPDQLIEEIEDTIKGKSSNFSAFVIASVRFALENMEKEDDDN